MIHVFAYPLHRSASFSRLGRNATLALSLMLLVPHARAQSSSEEPDLSALAELANAANNGVQTELVALPPLPMTAQLTYSPYQDAAPRPIDPAEARRRAEERGQKLLADLRTIGPIQDLPAVGSPAFTQLRASAFAIVQRRFQENSTTLEPDAVAAYRSNVTWKPNFSPAARTVSPADRERARAASYSLAYAITHLDRPRFVVAYATALFALDPDSALGAENAASAIVAAGERLYPKPEHAAQLKPFRDDAAVVYRYALARSVEQQKWTLRSLGILVNLGNLYVDLKDAARARPLLLAAVQFAPTSWDAAVALAACYEMQGRSELARAALDNARLSPSSIFAASGKGSRNLADSVEAGELTPESPEAEFEAVLQKFDRLETLTAADFVAQLDQSERNRMRAFVDNLPVKGSYRAPEIDGVTQFSTARSINRPNGIEALGDFAERVGSYGMVLLGGMMQQQEDFLGRLGLQLHLNVDMNDVMAHPEKYRNHKLEASVSGIEQLKSRVEQMRRQAEQARGELAMGNVSTLLQMGAASDPMIGIFQLKPRDYANPMDVMIQQYNASLLGRKMNAYNAYFFAVNHRTRESFADIVRLQTHKMNSIRAQENAETAIFNAQRAAAARAGANIHSAEWKLREHNLHMKFVPQYNDAVEFAWKQATQVAAIAYERKIAPRAERFYYDVFRHIALISDPAVRAKKNREFAQMLHHGVYNGLVNVLSAFGSFKIIDEWDCHCDVGSLLAQAEAERTALDAIADARHAREHAAKLRFKSGALPESSPLFQRIDAYGTDLNIPFIPLLSGRISCARTQLSLGADFPGAYAPKVNYTFSENAFTGATTHGGGLAIGVKVKDGDASASATLNTTGSISLDGKGKVTDYSVTGAAEVKIEMGPADVHAGAEIGYTPGGGLSSDVSAGAKVSFADRHGNSAELSFETSVRRGSTFAAKAEHNYNPFSDKYDAMINELAEDVSDYSIDTSMKKELWSGSYTF